MAAARLKVRVQPKARANEIAGIRGDAVVVRVTAAPEGGKANTAACELIAGQLGVPKSRVEVVTGATTRDKVLEIAGIDESEARRALGLP